MPLHINNDHASCSLSELVVLKEAGFSVVKSPHVGNQHPSNLLCAALGFDLNMVSFTQGKRDVNFHPHLRIQGGQAVEIGCKETWTPFARLSCGYPIERFHQDSLKALFQNTVIRTDMEIMREVSELTGVVLRTVTERMPDWWYRQVDVDGRVTKVSELASRPELSWDMIESDIYRISNHSSGWVVPVKAHMILQFALQALSSGRNTVYHLSGPQMTGYIGKLRKQLSMMYDSVRSVWTELPETLVVHVVPVAACRMIARQNNSSVVTAFDEVALWYESLPNEAKRHSSQRFAELVQAHGEIVLPIESAQTMSQYDLGHCSELVLSSWMMQSSLARVRSIHNRLCQLSK